MLKICNKSLNYCQKSKKWERLRLFKSSSLRNRSQHNRPTSTTCTSISARRTTSYMQFVSTMEVQRVATTTLWSRTTTRMFGESSTISEWKLSTKRQCLTKVRVEKATNQPTGLCTSLTRCWTSTSKSTTTSMTTQTCKRTALIMSTVSASNKTVLYTTNNSKQTRN